MFFILARLTMFLHKYVTALIK